MVVVVIVLSLICLFALLLLLMIQKKKKTDTEKDHIKAIMNQEEKETSDRIAVNYHFTRQCNYACKFCFHTAKTSHVETEENAKKILSLLRQGGFQKINFAGGEPFLEPKLLGKMCQYAKDECGYESVSIISNGSKIKEEWFKQFAKYVDILGISVDSIDDEVNRSIGRGSGNQLSFVRNAADLCKRYTVQFKINTVVNKYNHLETMSDLINELKPSRWKVFQVLALEGENIGPDARRNVEDLLIPKEQFEDYVSRNSERLIDKSIMKVEGNNVMQSSYVLVDEYGRMLDCSKGGKTPTKSILEVGVDAAWEELLGSEGKGFDASAFYARDGDYRDGCWSTSKGNIKDIEDIGW